ncbi:MAG: hypothetical protein MUC39_05530 [Candidatus Omnitrophica bacterium]|nr:hypothetical protein [Candidatus Omnitrophota bacterium]
MLRYALFLVGMLILGLLGNAFADDLDWQEISRGELNIKTVLINPNNPKIIYFGSGKGVFMTDDAGLNWRNVLIAKGENKLVNFLAANSDAGLIFAATGNGLFRSKTDGLAWQKIYKGKNYAQNDCTAVVAAGQFIYLGTKGGLFISNDNGRSWQKESGELANSAVLAIASDKNKNGCIYVACLAGVFKSKGNAGPWEKIFSASPVEKSDSPEEEADTQDEEEKESKIKSLNIDDSGNLYLVASEGIYQSKDKGLSWNLLPVYGLLSRRINSLFISKEGKLYAAGKSGVFCYEEERWRELSWGIAAEDFFSFAGDASGNLYIACSKGLFRGKSAVNSDKIMAISQGNEPGIKSIQDVAIKYAEVNPEKIIQWRKQAGKKAFLPKVSVSVNQNTSDLWHWETGSSTKAGDDTLVEGRPSVDWDFTFSWDLSDLIWNSDQTSIDTRSRLLVQLRNDILDEVNKIYFARLRVKMELDNLGIEERKKRLEKELRLQELTASLDALTGGYFSAVRAACAS